MDKKTKRSGIDFISTLTLIFIVKYFYCTKGNGTDFVVLVVGTKSYLAYVLVFRCYLFCYFGRRTNR